jgi:hypothetical protein
MQIRRPDVSDRHTDVWIGTRLPYGNEWFTGCAKPAEEACLEKVRNASEAMFLQ